MATDKEPPLTKKKKAWAKKFKPKRGIRGTTLNYPYPVQARYEKRLIALIDQMTAQTRRELEKFFKGEAAEAFFATDANVGSQANKVTNQLTKKFQQLFSTKAKGLAESMVNDADKASTANLHGSLKKLSGGLSLKTSVVTGDMQSVMTASVAENVGLIKSISEQYLKQVKGAVMRSIATGNGLQDLIPALEKYEGMTRRRAKNIALDQTRKAYNSLNVGRMKKLGVEKYEWVHTGGSQHPRPYHLNVLNGNIYSLDDPPIIDPKTGQRGKPADLPNCFLGTTEVSLANGCHHVWRYLHNGPIVKIILHSGSFFECTFNHPILTLRGFVAANEIEEGDYLVCGHGNRHGVIYDEVANQKTTFDDLFASDHINGGNVNTFSGSEFNFHGDIPENDVNAVSFNLKLPLRDKTPFAEKIEDFIFSLSDCGINNLGTGLFPEIFHPVLSGVSGKLYPLIFGKARHSNPCGMACVPKDDTLLLNNFGDFLAANTKSRGQRQNALPPFVSLNDILSGGICADDPFGRGYFVAPRSKGAGKMVAARSGQRAEFSHCHSAIKGLLRVDKKIVSIFSGHVYTMETSRGWYSVTSDNIITKNCGCRMRPIISFDEGGGDDDKP